MKNFIIISLIFTCLISSGSIYYFLEKNNSKNLKKQSVELEKKSYEINNLKDEKSYIKTIYEDKISNLKKTHKKEINRYQIKINNLTNEYEKRIINLKNNNNKIIKMVDKKERDDLIKIFSNKEKNDLMKMINEIRITGMDRGKWTLSKETKSIIRDFLTKEKRTYIIIPIMDNTKYKNDKNYLKNLGLSRKRASVAIRELKSLNSQNKIMISPKIITTDNERGFLIKEYK